MSSNLVSSQSFTIKSNKPEISRDAEINKDLTIMYTIFHTILLIYALYLSFKCNKGFSPIGFVIALFFPPIYILYNVAVRPECVF